MDTIYLSCFLLKNLKSVTIFLTTIFLSQKVWHNFFLQKNCHILKIILLNKKLLFRHEKITILNKLIGANPGRSGVNPKG